ncbi:MAG: PilZ domain-containing protein [Vulcanimicrobiaceae bacterium]
MPEPRRQAFRLDVNAELTVRLADLKRELRLLLVDISESGARFRAGVKLEPQTRVTFNWMGPSRQPIPINGTVVAVRMTDPKTAEYGIQFNMPVADRDRLAHELLEVQRRRAYRPAAGEHPAATAAANAESDLGGRAKRQGYRAAFLLPIMARINKEGRWTTARGEAQDISSGGMLVALPGAWEENTELQIMFTLPVGAVDLGGEEKDVLEQTPFGERRVKKILPVRPFDPIEAKARIVKKTGGAKNGIPLYGVGFVELSPFLQEEIARFVHAFQVTQLRKAAATQG